LFNFHIYLKILIGQTVYEGDGDKSPPYTIKRGVTMGTYKKFRAYDSTVHVYEFNPYIERLDLEFGVWGKKEKLSTIGKPRDGEVIAAKINCGFFSKTIDHSGTLIDEGLYYQAPEKYYTDLIFTKDNKLMIDNIDPLDKEKLVNLQFNSHFTCGTSFTLIQNGEISITNVEAFPHYKYSAPRTAIGQKLDKTICFVVVDGRRVNEKGVDARQLAMIMYDLNCYVAVNLDGGGSSEMIVDGKIVNKPSDGQERYIGTALIVYKKIDNKKDGANMKNPMVYVSPSTQENNVGVSNYGTEEKQMNDIADIVCRLLDYNDITYARNTPDMTLTEIVDHSNDINPKIHVAIHSNAHNGKARGCEVWGFLIDGVYTNSQKLSECIYKELEPLTPTADRGVKNGVKTNFAEITKVKATSCIVEVAFHDNIEDALWIINNKPEIAAAIVKGICNYFGLPFKSLEQHKDSSDIKLKKFISELESLIKMYK
jgi:N-acetylmuramoyl-L-alanine amidase